MIPLGRSIPNLPGNTPTTSTQANTGLGGAAPGGGAGPADFNSARRRSSIDAIMGHLRYVGSFPSRVMQDLSQPNAINRPGTPGGNLPGGFLGMQSQTSFGSSTGSLRAFGRSFTDVNAAAAQPQAAPVKTTQGGSKVPAAEAFLSI
ncbi:uncharacterized protein EV422DRAFT_565118 [Fimicolochytrium jonesii]|uniref:uncharacterized protein n=1 Tax=Fimicolochytrium jonesii TaxID=1396493 RepID=UPI0022FEBA3C|nr:uncharacterized protein EV422DRAFT_565118 [Fimicolochytrium jonesii]KAI8824426.1 hypothetical protein EV422DRAFT_565118 [Fimicolochytrium jonesii]